jgi:hypothetical protein
LIDLSVTAQNEGHLGVAEMRGGFDESVKHGLQLRHRATDDFEYVSSGGLLL